jgi:transposase
MAYKFLATDCHQPFLLPPDLRDWRPADHLARFILDVVDQLDLEPLLRCYRADGHGHPAYHPKTLLAVLLYAYASGCAPRARSSAAAPRNSPFGCWPATARLTR